MAKTVKEREAILFTEKNLRMSESCRFCIHRGKTTDKTSRCIVHNVDVNTSFVCDDFLQTNKNTTIKLAQASFPKEEDWYGQSN